MPMSFDRAGRVHYFLIYKVGIKGKKNQDRIEEIHRIVSRSGDVQVIQEV